MTREPERADQEQLPAFELRLASEEDIPALQQVYEAAPEHVTVLLGHPADPAQAAQDFAQAIATPGRFQFMILLDRAPIGMIDCKLDDSVEGMAHVGLLLLARPYNTAPLASLALRVLQRWLAASYAVRRLMVHVPAHDRDQVAFWQSEGFDFTGEQYRRELGTYLPRFLVMARDLPL